MLLVGEKEYDISLSVLNPMQMSSVIPPPGTGGVS
jgi:hypothetical protein